MACQTFETLEVWQLARKFAGEIYRAIGGCRDYNFRNQITDAGCSISNNIAEDLGYIEASLAERLRKDSRHIGGMLYSLISCLSDR